MRAVILIGLAMLSSLARADGDPELARRHFETGKTLYARARYADAIREFEAARAVLKSPPFDYNIGVCYELLGRADEAADAFERFAEADPAGPQSGATWKRVAQLRSRRVTAQVIDSKRPRLRLAGISLLGVGAGGLLAAVAPGVLSLDARDRYRDGCAVGLCDAGLYEHGRALSVATDVLLASAAVITVTGVALLGVSLRRPPSLALSATPEVLR